MEPDALKALVSTMRELGVRSLKTAAFEVVLDPTPPAPPGLHAPLAAEPPRRSFEDVLFAHTGRSRRPETNNTAQGAPP